MKFRILSFVAVAAILMVGCETPEGYPNRTGTGALLGGGIGAASGAIIGGRHAGAGALIGGALGAVTGGLIGQSMDQEAQARLRAQAPQTYVRIDQGQPLGLPDIEALARAGVSDDVIITQINSTHTAYRLSAADIIQLHNAGVSERVIEYMINASGTAGAQPIAVVTPPPPAPPEDAVVLPSPGPTYVWVGGEWEWRGQWVWRSGHWASPPYPRANWVHGYWIAGPHGWRRVPGYWR